MTVTVELSPEMERFISDKLGRGEFRSADEMMCVALQHMVEDEAEMAHTEALLREAEESGEYVERLRLDDHWARSLPGGRAAEGSKVRCPAFSSVPKPSVKSRSSLPT